MGLADRVVGPWSIIVATISFILNFFISEFHCFNSSSENGGELKQRDLRQILSCQMGLMSIKMGMRYLSLLLTLHWWIM
ncbi:hypothetical protein QN277_007427 [Acacia crassicarpa]|uniref:Uncharacterized protein n=1 Tax=Acacia crassicarpa TaxID=499986 RepID=A0AAE1JRE5_9FABA|nr:hypothetical protein QN277_007427 [Acacia crassicarpa]